MKLRFWGTRGSIPVALTAPQIRSKLINALTLAKSQQLESDEAIARFVDTQLTFDQAGTFGGNTSCVEIALGDEAPQSHIICDMGSGARPLGQSMLSRFGPAAPQTYHIFMSHLHWDHIMGFPFFAPVYIPGNRIIIHGCHAELEHAFRRQQGNPSFPVAFDHLAARIDFNTLAPGIAYDIGGCRVVAKKQLHGGDSYGYRFERNGVSVVYSTDSEHRLEHVAEREAFTEFFDRADAVIFDAMYSLADAISVKADWGHSSNIVGVELCQAAHAKRLVMFHHEPANEDARIQQLLEETRRFEEITRDGHSVEILAAWDGMELSLQPPVTRELHAFPARMIALPDVLKQLRMGSTGVDAATCLRAETAVEELFANSVHHGYGGNAPDVPPPLVWLGAMVTEGVLAVSYQDAAPAYDPFQHLDKIISTLNVPMEQRPVGGLGRLMVKRLADASDYTREGERNCIELRFAPR